ncbi:MAG TPA: CHAD domain-containing protein [Opitutus sp.]|nr:CHAD domain-containing protein [Opitutus sp.]
MSFKLNPSQHAGDEIVRTIRDQIGAATKAVRNPRMALFKRVHLARTCCKKARAALQLLRTLVPAGFRTENRAIGDAARGLSALRDAEAIIGCLDALLTHYAAKVERRQFVPVIHALQKERKRAIPPSADVEDSLKRFVDRLAGSDARLGQWKPNDDAESIIADHRRTYRRARRRLQRAKEMGTATAFHEWRIATKAYYHQCQLLRATWPPVMKVIRAEVKTLANLLGDDHDLTVLRDALRRLRKQGRLEIREELLITTVGLVETRREELRQQALPLGERIYADRSRAVAERMAEWWRVARNQPTRV